MYIGPAADGGIPSLAECSEWLNLNSFTARMLRGDLFDGSLFAIWKLRAALEQENVSKTVANSRISTANEWMITSGRQLYNKVWNAGPLDGEGARGDDMSKK